ncbi:MAG: hypothetical protein U0798_11150 [Gemmataceae bacterium]
MFGARLHQHGPLYNYTPGYGGGAYGCGAGCTSPWGNHGDRMSCGRLGGGFGFNGFGGFGGPGLLNHGGNSCNSCGRGGWGHYAVSTFQNVFHRVHPFASRCGHTCSVGCGGGCSTCGGPVTAAPAAAPVQAAPKTMPAPVK